MATPPVFSAGAVLTAAQMNAVGLWLVKTQTVTTGANADISSAFSSSYNNYRVVVDTNLADATSAVRFSLLAGTTNNAANWDVGGIRWDVTAAAFSNIRTTSAAYAEIAVVSTGECGYYFDVFGPQQTRETTLISNGADVRGFSGLNPWLVTAILQNNTSYDGFRLALASGNWTNVTVRVYGYTNG